MKKFLTLAFALVFTTGIAFGQNNTATVNQSGSSSSATVDQQGSDHTAFIDQSSSFGSGHSAEVYQSGGSDNFSDVLQDQANAEALIDQIGSDNEARTKQSGFNDLDVYQEGDGNILGQYSNLSNRAFQKNGTGVFASDKNILDVDQIGDQNKAGTWQEHHGEATIEQYGSYNDGRIYQSGAPGQSLNKATIKQGVPNYVSDDNSADIYQNGEGNEASFALQMGDQNSVDIDQFGDQNYSEFFVKYGDMNDVTMDVDGVGNRTRFSIDAGWGSKSSSNVVTFNKDGDNNYLSGQIEGDGNVVDVIQNGSNNRVGTSWHTSDGVSILGNSNTVDITQMSNANSATVTVSGNSNTATVTQN